jgi:hypothetical protein
MKTLNQNQYAELYEKWKNRKPNEIFWTHELAVEYGASSTEALRSSFRRYRGTFTDTTEDEYNRPITHLGSAEVGVFDIEVAPMLTYAFRLYDDGIGPENILTDPYMLSWSAKMLNQSEIFSDVASSKEAVEENDYRIVKSLYDFLSTCDIVIGQNIKGYDLRMLNTRLAFYNIPPLRRFQIIDTYVVAKKEFRFPSNSLKYINRFFGIQQKQENEGLSLWKKCMRGDKDALNRMDEYCKGDVVATEDLYFKIRPYITGHPNLALYFDDIQERCPNCGSTNLMSEGSYFTPAGRWNSMRCQNCQSLSRSKYNELSTKKRKNLQVN